MFSNQLVIPIPTIECSLKLSQPSWTSMDKKYFLYVASNIWNSLQYSDVKVGK